MDHGDIVPLLYYLRGIVFGAIIKKHKPLFTSQIYLSVCLLADDIGFIWDYMVFIQI